MSPYYSDGAVTLYHGDCREVLEWLEADVLVTDPPYGQRYVSGGPRTKGVTRVNGSTVHSVTPVKSVDGDADTTVRDAALTMWGTRPALVFGRWNIDRPAAARARLIWFKRNTNPALGTHTPWSPADEEVYVLGDGWVGSRELNVLITDEPRSGVGGLAAQVGHPTPKPVGLMCRLLEHTVGVVADPFAGSGSTLLAAKQLGRRVIGVEKDEAYCEVAAKRLSQEVLDFGAAS